jgi:hypothetical protein
MESEIIYICILVILCLEILKLCGSCEYFSDGPASYYTLSNYEESNPSDTYVAEDEEELVGIQLPNKERQWKYSHIRAPIGRYMTIYAKRLSDGAESTLNTNIIKNTDNNGKILNIFGFNNALIPNNKDTIKYYVKFLSTEQYNKEREELGRIKELKYKYNMCVNGYKGSMPANQIAAMCKNL